MSLLRSLQAVGEVREREPMSRHTTLGIGGPADYYVVAHDAEGLRRVALIAREGGVPLFVLGSGSNIVVGDGGIRGVVVENQAETIGEPEQRDGYLALRAEAGVPFARFTRHAARAGLTGLEWAAGIPGSVGGAVVYNAGAYGGCLADVLHSIRVLGPGEAAEEMLAEVLHLSYRSSDFTRGLLADRVILDLTFALQWGDAEASLARIGELETKRKRSSPTGRSAGSTFKNPQQHAAWWLVDQVGMRGHRIGDAQVSEKHSNYFLNVGQARAADFMALVRLAQQRVQEMFGIDLETEVTPVGEGFA